MTSIKTIAAITAMMLLGWPQSSLMAADLPPNAATDQTFDTYEAAETWVENQQIPDDCENQPVICEEECLCDVCGENGETTATFAVFWSDSNECPEGWTLSAQSKMELPSKRHMHDALDYKGGGQSPHGKGRLCVRGLWRK